MVGKKFINDVIKALPELSYVGIYFYVKPVDHIMTGFVCEKMPSRARVYQYSYPLYHQSESPVLTFSEQLKGDDGWIKFEDVKKVDLSQAFVSRISGLVKSSYNNLSLESFAKFIEDREAILRNHKIRSSYAFTLIMLDRGGEAQQQLERLMDQPLTDPVYDDFNKVNQQVLEALLRSADSARDMICAMSRSKRNRLGV